MAVINRDKYLNKLVNKINNGMVKVITGLRRSGKSYLLNTLFYNHLVSQMHINPQNIIQFAFDDENDLKKIDENLLDIKQNNKKVDPQKFSDYLFRLIDGKSRYFILLDEVQELAAFEFILNSLLKKENVDIYVTGSNAKFLSQDILTEFRGRGDEIHVFPLSFFECWKYYDSDINRALDKYMIYGGLPRAVLAKNDEERFSYIKQQLDKTYLTDIIERFNVRNDSELKELLNVIASGISSLTNPKKLADTFNTSKKSNIDDKTIKKYIDYFKDSFLINQADKYDVKGKRYISTPFKLYFEDVGVRNVLLNLRQIEKTHLMENIVYNELRYRGYAVDVGQVEIRERVIKPDTNDSTFVRKTLETDFVANKGNVRYYVQSAFNIDEPEKKEQEIKSLKNIDDSFKKIVIVFNNLLNGYDKDGIYYLDLRDFLIDESSLEK